MVTSWRRIRDADCPAPVRRRTMPVGVSLGPDGVLSGTPKSVGSFSGTVRARDALDRTVDRPYAFAVAAPAPTIGTVADLTTDAGVAVSLSPSFLPTGYGPYSYALLDADRLPAAPPAGWRPVSFSATTGALEGRPLQGGSWGPYVIRAFDGTGQHVDTNPFSLTTAASAIGLAAAPASLWEGEVVAYRATTNVPSPTWSIANNPGWVSIDQGGNVSGRVPDVASDKVQAYTVLATGDGVSAQSDASHTVRAYTAGVTGLQATYVTNGAVSATATTTLPGPVTWTLEDNALGLSVSAAGAIDGPTGSLTRTVVTQAVATKGGVTARIPFTIVVAAPSVASVVRPLSVTGFTSNAAADIDRLYDNSEGTTVGVAGSVFEYTYASPTTADRVQHSFNYTGSGLTAFYFEYFNGTQWVNPLGTSPVDAFNGVFGTPRSSGLNTTTFAAVTATRFRIRSTQSWTGSMGAFRVGYGSYP